MSIDNFGNYCLKRQILGCKRRSPGTSSVENKII